MEKLTDALYWVFFAVFGTGQLQSSHVEQLDYEVANFLVDQFGYNTAGPFWTEQAAVFAENLSLLSEDWHGRKVQFWRGLPKPINFDELNPHHWAMLKGIAALRAADTGGKWWKNRGLPPFFFTVVAGLKKGPEAEMSRLFKISTSDLQQTSFADTVETAAFLLQVVEMVSLIFTAASLPVVFGHVCREITFYRAEQAKKEEAIRAFYKTLQTYEFE